MEQRSKNMRAVRVPDYGRRATVEEVTIPTVGPGEALVRVAGLALNPLDLKIVGGHVQELFPVEFPYTLGTDLSGTVTEVGPEVTDWKAGDRVLARLDPARGGAAAEVAAVPVDQLVRAPTSVPLPVASGAATAAATAHQALVEVAGVRPGQTVLVHAGAGGVGSFAVQIARGLGARVVATATGEGLRIAHRLGAHEVVDYAAVDFTSAVGQVDVVLDTVGGATEERSLAVLKPGGLLAALPVPPDGERAEAHGVRAEFVFHTSDAERLAKVVDDIDGGVRVLLDRMVPLDETPAALDHLSRGRAKGKVVLVADRTA